MDCLKATTMMQRFVADELSIRETKDFIRHITSCKECYDETEVLLLVYKADTMFSDDRSPDYDFSDLLKKKIQTFQKQLFRRRILAGIFMTTALLITILLVAILIFYLNR